LTHSRPNVEHNDEADAFLGTFGGFSSGYPGAAEDCTHRQRLCIESDRKDLISLKKMLFAVPQFVADLRLLVLHVVDCFMDKSGSLLASIGVLRPVMESVLVRHRYCGIFVNAESSSEDALGSKTLKGMLYCIRHIKRRFLDQDQYGIIISTCIQAALIIQVLLI
jgi:hypothetical protein